MRNNNYSSQPSKKSKNGCSKYILIIITLLGIYSAIRYNFDRKNYFKAYEAYTTEDCFSAIQLYDEIVHKWRLFDFGKYKARAQQEQLECQEYQIAINKQTSGDSSGAILAYNELINNHTNSLLINGARNRIESIFLEANANALASESLCDQINILEKGNLIPQIDNIHSNLLYECGVTFEAVQIFSKAIQMYMELLNEYPTYVHASSVKDSYIQAFIKEGLCEQIDSLERENQIPQNNTILPNLLYECGKSFEDNKNLYGAIQVYEEFFNKYPNHALATNVEEALARAIIIDAKESGAGIIPSPERSGSTNDESVNVIIQNDSPERLRIIFSGPKSQIEELSACDTCIIYSVIAPMYCPEEGPIGTYTLPPGQYDVVVQSISDTGVTPWTGEWDLISGEEYSSCFFITEIIFP